MHVEFNSAAQGFPLPITWQWQGSSDGSSWVDLADGSGYSGVTTPSLGIDFEDASLDGWSYRAVASNDFVSAISDAATLTITDGSGIS